MHCGISIPPMSALPPKADIDRRARDVRFVPILLQKSPTREARCALAPNTSLDLEVDYADDLNATSVT